MFEVWKKHTIINYYSLATLLLVLGLGLFWADIIEAKYASLIIGLALGFALNAISARMVIILFTAFASLVTFGLFYPLINYSQLPVIFSTTSCVLIGYSLTFSKGRWFIILYGLSLAVVTGIATFFDLLLPTS